VLWGEVTGGCGARYSLPGTAGVREGGSVEQRERTDRFPTPTGDGRCSSLAAARRREGRGGRAEEKGGAGGNVNGPEAETDL